MHHVVEKASDGVLAKVVVRKSARQVDQATSWRVFKRAGYRCEYCGKDDVPLTVDHVITWESGGPTTDENLKSSCRKCNKTRGNLPYEEWLRSKHYLVVSKGLSPEVRAANAALVDRLADIPLVKNIRSRGK